MTLVDLHDAIEGFNELEKERNENYLEGVRIIAFYAAAPHVNTKKRVRLKNPRSILKLDRDKERRRSELKGFPPVTIEVIQKENGE